jgi:proteic killer suppression protein
MIQSFKNKLTKNIWDRKRTKLSVDVQNQALKRLRILNAAVSLSDLRFPPSNKFHALSGDRKDQYAIRVNQQYRICFKWNSETACPYDVEFIDYH